VHSKRSLGPLRDGTDVIVFRLLFPEEDVSRKYGMQETRLAKLLVKILVRRGIPERTAARILKWDSPCEDTGAGRQGCLGEEVRQVLSSSCQVSNTLNYDYNLIIVPQNVDGRGGKTLHDLEALLDQLARHCRFSQHAYISDESALQPVESILQDIYDSVTPEEASFITQVLLKDLRPLYYPLTLVHTTSNLLKGKSTINEFKIYQAMKAWHPQLPSIYRVYADLDQSFDILRNGIPAPYYPIVGTPVQVRFFILIGKDVLNLLDPKMLQRPILRGCRSGLGKR
jgi:DNA ligase 4